VAETLPVLWQTEWCPFSSAVREVLTELGIDFVARQVEPWPNERKRLREAAGSDRTPVLETEDGRTFRGTREIFAHLHEREPWRFDAAHRRRFADHRDARETDVPGQLIEYFRGTDELESGEGTPAEAEVVDVSEKNRYELRLNGRLVGLAAYRRRNGRIVFTHTEVDPACSGHGFGSRLAAAVLDDARKKGLEVAPLCPFITRYIEQHPEYEDLVAASYRDRSSVP
jgi:predicted GNAT family acetyltransferase/glutaredoxin